MEVFQANKLYKWIYRILAGIFLCIVIWGNFFSYDVDGKINILKVVQTVFHFPFEAGLLPLIGIYLIIGFLCYYLYKKLTVMNNRIMVLMLLFLLALLPRLLVCSLQKIYPVNDFQVYLNFAKQYINRDYTEIAATVNGYGLPSLAGLAYINGFIGRFFGTEIINFQIASCVIASLTCPTIYLIGKQYNKTVGILAAFLYAFYPANIIFSQMITNQHGATLFYLLSIYLCHKAYKASSRTSFLWMMASGLCAVIGGYFHPSGVVIKIAVLLFSAFIVLSVIKRKKLLLKTAALLIVFLFTTVVFQNMMDNHFINKGILYEDSVSVNMLVKIIQGLNLETYGGIYREDTGLFTDDENPNRVAMEEIKNRLSKIKNLPEFFSIKLNKVWFSEDGTGVCAQGTDGINNRVIGWGFVPVGAKDEEVNRGEFFYYNASQKRAIPTLSGSEKEAAQKTYDNMQTFTHGYLKLDYMFLFFIYLFAAIGVFVRKNKGILCITDLLLWFELGFMGVYLISEIQARYRYVGMPVFFVFAAIGIHYILSNMSHVKSYYTDLITTKRTQGESTGDGKS